MYPPTSPPPTSDIQVEALGPYPLPPVNPSSLSGFVDSDDRSSDVVDKFAYLKVTPPDCERTERLKALPECEEVRGAILESMEKLGKTFKLTEQEPSIEDLEPVEALKKKANSDLLQQQFEAVVKFSAGVTSCLKEFQELRKPFDDLASAKNTTVTQQTEAAIRLRDELSQNAANLFLNRNILSGHSSDIWKFKRTSVKKTQNKIESILFAEHDQQEDIQFTLDLLKDGERVAPKVKEPSGLVATSLEGIAKYGFLRLATRQKNKMQESKMLQDAYQVEKSKVEALKQKLDESVECLDTVNDKWSGIRLTIYSNTLIIIDEVSGGNTSLVACAKRLDETEGKLLTLIELIDNFLAQVTKDYGFQFRTREIKRLCHHVPNIFTALEMLLSAKAVVVDSHQHIYEEHIYELCKVISEHFEVMKDVYLKCRIAVNVERQAAHLGDNVPDIQIGTGPHLEAIKNIAQAHISKAKSKEAGKKRNKEDKYHKNVTLTRPGRPLIKEEEILWALHKVVDALSLIQAVSKASDPCDKSTASGENVENVEDTAADRTPEWLKMPDEMISQFYEVLFGESKKLQFLKDNREKSFPAKQTYERLDSNFEEPGEPGGRFSQLRRLMSRKLH